MYKSVRREQYWPHMADEVYATVRDFHSCPQNRKHGKCKMAVKTGFNRRRIEISRYGHTERSTKGETRPPICSRDDGPLYETN